MSFKTNSARLRNAEYIITIFCIVLAAAIAIPHLPGAGTRYFAGISAFVGLAISVSAGASVSDLISGIILIYFDPLQEGDWIRLDDIEGKLERQSLFTHILRNLKGIRVTIRNSTILQSKIMNLGSVRDNPAGIVGPFSTQITLGYDVHWEKVEVVLKQSTLSIQGIYQKPPYEPYVRQTSLDDFYVSYDINFFTSTPERISAIRSELHANIQDRCGDTGIEILSPHYDASRSGEQIAIPNKYIVKP